MEASTGIIDQYATISGGSSDLEDLLFSDGRLVTSYKNGGSGSVKVGNFTLFQPPKIISASASDSNPTSNTTPNTATNSQIKLDTVPNDFTSTATVKYSDGSTTKTEICDPSIINYLSIDGLNDGPITIKITPNGHNRTGESTLVEILKDTQVDNVSVSAPAYVNGVFNITKSASDGQGVQSEILKVNGTEITSNTFTPSVEGTQNIEYIVLDNVGNERVKIIENIFDATQPNASLNGIDALTSQAIHLATSSNDALSGIASQVLRGGKDSLNVISDGQFDFTEGDGTYNFQYEVTDGAGNSRILTGQSVFDSTNPLAEILGLQQYTSSSLNVTSNCSDENGIRYTVLEKNGVEISEGLVEFSEDGVYGFTLTACDNAGNKSVVNGQTVYDTTLPVASVSAPAYANGPFTIHSTASDANGIDSERLLVNGTELSTSTYAPSAEGPQNIEYMVQDPAGNQATTSTQTIFDMTKPDIALEIEVEGYYARISASVSDNIALHSYTAEISRNGGEYQDLELVSGESLEKALSNGTYRVRVTGVDEAGNMEQVEYEFAISEQPAAAEHWHLY